MIYSSTQSCEDEQRRHQVRRSDFNGLDYLEVSDDQLTLTVFFLGHAPAELQRRPKEIPAAHDERLRRSVRIEGGRRVRDIRVVAVELCDQPDPELDDCLIVTVDKPGDFCTYRLCLVALDERGRPTGKPFPNFDPRYACLDFSFKVNYSSDLDCATDDACPPEAVAGPDINYLARDYASFRQLILDRLSVIMPEWRERHVPDVGIALVEVLAYTGDYLSYYQDAVATEAYLDTARRRVSVRRHARLVDYLMHEGSNARAWLHLEVEDDLKLDPDDVTFSTGLGAAATGVIVGEDDLRQLPGDSYELFAPLVNRPPRPYRAVWQQEFQRWTIEAGVPAKLIQLYEGHNAIRFYTWGDGECCLPRGATSATLVDGRAVEQTPDDPQQKPPQAPVAAVAAPPAPVYAYERQLAALKVGDYLLFEEVIGPTTGNPADADPAHRHVVRLTKVEPAVDELYHQPVVEIVWDAADALPFPLCLSTSAAPPECGPLVDISLARGNLILVDHGRPVRDEDLGCVPVAETEAECDCGRLGDARYVPGRFRPRLRRGPLTHSRPLPENAPAARLLAQDPRLAAPAIRLVAFPDPGCKPDGRRGEAPLPLPAALWDARPDLLSSAYGSLHFVAELDEEGRAVLRFGDGNTGYRPDANSRFVADYRVGNGPAGNVGAGAIAHVVYRLKRPSGIRLVRNPLPAAGGVAPEPISQVKLLAPTAFRRRLERAVTAEDYAAIVMRDFPNEVQRAAATLRWMGSWYEVLLAIDARGRAEADQTLLDRIAAHLERYRRAGHDLAVDPARQVSLDVALQVNVRPGFPRGHVKAALLDVFSSRNRRDGRPGYFHPDRLSFGQGIYLSHLVAAAQAVPGVESVDVKRLERLYEGPNGEVAAGVLSLHPLEVARLDNDPNFPENGLLTLEMRGGR